MPRRVKKFAKRPGGRAALVSARVFDATLALLVERGFGDFSLSELAERAGVTRSTLYRRWPVKSALILDAIAARINQQILLADTGSFAGDFAAALKGLALFLNSPVGRAAISAGLEIDRTETIVAQWKALGDARLAAIRAIFERAVARGEFPRGGDWEAFLAAAAGAMYFRVIVTSRDPDAAWIARVLKMLMPLAQVR
jgi:AcrR family transcriptional regulator